MCEVWCVFVCVLLNRGIVRRLCGLVKIFKFEIATNQTIFQSKASILPILSRLVQLLSCIIQQRTSNASTKYTHTHTRTHRERE